jgi:hypothetical protein
MKEIQRDKFEKVCEKTIAPSKTYPINDVNFEKWIDDQEGNDKIVARTIRKYTKHVSFSELYEVLKRIVNDFLLCVETQKYTNIYLITGELKKSNFWISTLFYNYLMLLKKNNTIAKIFGDYDKKHLNKMKNSLFVFCDDCSYSGNQLAVNIRDLGFNVLNKKFNGSNYLFLVCPFMSNVAKERIMQLTRNVIISNQVSLFNTLLTNVKTYESKEVQNVVEHFEDKNLCTIYFDHKLADMVSIFQTVYALGSNISKKERIKPLTLIKGCKNAYKDVDNDDTIGVLDLQAVIGKKKMCPPPLYKLIKYTYNGTIIKKISDLY